MAATAEKILIVRFSSIGDIVLTTPIVRRLHQQQSAEIHYLTKRQFAPLLEHNPHITRIWTIDSEIDEVLPELREQRFDALIDLHRNLRTWRLKRALGVKSSTFPKLNVRKWLFVNFHLRVMPSIHIVDRYMEALRPWSVQDDGQGLDFFTGAGDETVLSQLPQKPYVALVVGGTHAGKRLPIEKLLEICRELRAPVIVLGGPEDRDVAERLEKAHEHVLSLAGQISLMESALAVRESALVITHDTGLMHIAAAFGKIVYSVWGATVPEFGMTPYRADSRSQLFRPGNKEHLPYSKLGDHKWYKGPFRGMNQIDVKRMVNQANLILS